MAELTPGPHHIQACTACVKSKRKCTRQSPACHRCRSRGLDCSYPQPHGNWIILPETPPSTSSPETQLSPPELDADTALRGLDPLIPLDEDEAHAQLSSWFTSIHTWHTVRSEELELDTFLSFDIESYVGDIRNWLDLWVRTGSNPFIHPEMYRSRFPRSVQDAYLCLSCYQNRTDANEQLVLRMLKDRSEALLKDHGFDIYGQVDFNYRYTAHHRLDLVDHVARLQALLIYQFIDLFESKHSRHLAQRRIDLMESWAREMISAAAASVPSGSEDILEPANLDEKAGGDFMQLLWHSWILSETVRRTWNVVSSMIGLFSILETGKPAPCPGGMMVTTRVNVWEAKTATEWQEICAAKATGLMQISDATRLIYDTKSKEINSFAKTILELAYGKKRVRQWTALSESP